MTIPSDLETVDIKIRMFDIALYVATGRKVYSTINPLYSYNTNILNAISIRQFEYKA